MKTLRTLYIFFMATILLGCAIENPEDAKKFKYNFQGTKFRQVKYRSIDDNNAYRFHQGIRTIQFGPVEYDMLFQNYIEFSLIPCYGPIKGRYTMTDKDGFLNAVNGTGADSTDSNGNGVYDIFEPYGPEEPAAPTPSDRVDLVEYFMIIDIESNAVSPACPIPTDSKLYYQFLFYQNGDLILRDYNREIEFFYRPI